MNPRVGSVPWRRLAPFGVGAMLLVPAAPGVSAQAPGLPDVLGDWTQPFEATEAIQPFPDDAPAPTGGSATPDEDTSTVNGVQSAVIPASGLHRLLRPRRGRP